MINLPVIFLLISNLIPLYGVVFLGWNFTNIIFLYWFENVIIGFFTVIKMFLAENIDVRSSHPQTKYISPSVLKYFLIVFFIIHFGMFTFGHGLLLSLLFGRQIDFQSSLFIAIIALFVSHGESFVKYYLKPKNYLRTSPALLIFAPYPRVIVVHLTVIILGFFIMSKLSIVSFVLFILMKTIVDLGSHILEHSQKNPYGLHPVFDKLLVNMFKRSVDAGNWAEIAKTMDPQEREKIESFYRKRGVSV